MNTSIPRLSWLDAHVHLDKLEEGPEVAIAKALQSGVERMITIGTDPGDLPVVLELAEKYAPHVFCTLGIHPHEGAIYSKEVGEFIQKNISHPRCLAVGEIGLDYYYEQSPIPQQKQAFRAQLEIAKAAALPVEIHTRDAEVDTVDILKEFTNQVSGIIHCFTGTEWLARQVLDLGYSLSISGVVTFKNATALREIVKFVPLDSLLIETDAPFLAPVPQRGRPNTPSYVVHTAKVVAELKGISLEELAVATEANAAKIFPKLTRF